MLIEENSALLSMSYCPLVGCRPEIANGKRTKNIPTKNKKQKEQKEKIKGNGKKCFKDVISKAPIMIKKCFKDVVSIAPIMISYAYFKCHLRQREKTKKRSNLIYTYIVFCFGSDATNLK